MPLRFETELPVEAPAPNRMDVACFVGFVRPRAGASSAAVQGWLAEQGWLESPAGLRMPYARASAATLLDVPVPIESWAVFDRLYAWDERPMEGTDALAATYLGAAVRSFFAEGGRRCYVVRAGDDWPVPGGATVDTDEALAATRFARLQALVPGYPGSLAASPADRTTWHGVAHVFGLPDVSFLCCPDLADIVRAPAVPPDVKVSLPPVPEQFVECTDTEPIEDDAPAHRYHAPRARESDYDDWCQVLRIVRDALIAGRCEAQLVATVPMPVPGSTVERTLGDLLATGALRGWGGDAGLRQQGSRPGDRRVGSFVQLVYPWAATRGGRGLPEGLEPSEGVLAGVLARNALLRGTFRSAAGLELSTVDDVQPPLAMGDLGERVSLVGPTPRGMELLTDVTASGSEPFRPAGVHRLVSAIIRGARRVGEDAVFDASGERLWAGITTRMEQILLALWHGGAFRGARPADAFDVRCDRTTMTQADLDAGRAVAIVRFAPAAPIEAITVVLALEAAALEPLAAAGAA